MLSSDTKRPNYRDGQYLVPADFVAEQRYHGDLRRRAALGHHTWGIFVGLELEEVPREGSSDHVDLFITPGFAIDGYGRELIAYAPQKLDAALFLSPTQPAGWVPVWIRYAPELTDPPRYGYEICEDPDFANRTRETFRIEVGERQIWHDAVTVAGKAVPDEELPVHLSVPHQGLPDDVEDARWRVLLGYSHWDGATGFLKSETEQDHEQRVNGRVHGGVISAHTYPPADRWELATRHRPQGGVAPRVAGTIRGSLTVEDVVVALGDGIKMHDSALSFLDENGADRDRPLTLTRVDDADGADLRLQLGEASAGENRLVIDSGKTERLVIRDDGSVDMKGNLQVDGILDLVEDDGDRIILWGDPGDELAAAIGVEGSGTVLYSRAETALRWYVGAEPDGGGSARMALGSNRLSIRGDALVGWGANGSLKTRHVQGKDWQGDGDDDLFLNWNTARDVHVGGGSPASLRVHGNATVGAGGNGRLKTRHVDGKNWTNDNDDNLHLNWDSGRSVVVGSPGVHADLVVNGNMFLGTTKVPVDVVVGRHPVNLSGSPGSNSGFVTVPVTTRLPSVSQKYLTVALSDIQNDSVATSARWQVAWTGGVSSGGGNLWNFLVQWRIDDIDGHIFEFSWTAVFVP